MPVRWESDNMLLLPYGASFQWSNSTELATPSLLIPDADTELYLDGQQVGESSSVMFFDQPYRKILLPSGGTKGSHTLELRSLVDTPTDAIYLTGDFDVHIKTGGDFSTKNFSFYNMSLYSPASAEVTLSTRSRRLRMESWAEQGAPFYSGAVTYLVEIDHKGGRAKLVLPKVYYVCSLKCDGEEIGWRIWPPYEFDLELSHGRHLLEITVYNTMANMMEGYRAPSGIGK